jgi:hypothetical protein
MVSATRNQDAVPFCNIELPLPPGVSPGTTNGAWSRSSISSIIEAAAIWTSSRDRRQTVFTKLLELQQLLTQLFRQERLLF